MSDLGKARNDLTNTKKISDRGTTDEIRRIAKEMREHEKEIKAIENRQRDEVKILSEINEKIIKDDQEQHRSKKECITTTYQEKVQNIRSNNFFAQFPQGRADLLKTLEDDFSKEVRSMDEAFNRKMQSQQSAFAKKERELLEKHSREMHRTVRRQQGWTEPAA